MSSALASASVIDAMLGSFARLFGLVTGGVGSSRALLKCLHDLPGRTSSMFLIDMVRVTKPVHARRAVADGNRRRCICIIWTNECVMTIWRYKRATTDRCMAIPFARKVVNS